MTNNYQSSVIFLTGATGLVGSSIVSKLLESEVNIIALVRKNSDKEKIAWLTSNNIKILVGDLLDINSFKFHLGTCDIVIHAAAAVQLKSRKKTWEINVEGSRNIINAMREFNIKKLIHISTVGVYGQSSPDLISEKLQPRPIGNYSTSKYEAEKILLRYSDEIDITILRPPFIFGSTEFDRHVIPTINKLLNKRVLPSIWGKNPEFGFVHARDIASAVMLAASVESTSSDIYNIQSFSLSYRELISYGEIIHGHGIILVPIPLFLLRIGAKIADLFVRLFRINTSFSRRLRTFERRWVFSTEKIENDLKWAPQHTDREKILIKLLEINNQRVEETPGEVLVEESIIITSS